MNFDYTTNVLLSSPNTILEYPQTRFEFDYYPPIDGYILPVSSYKIVSDNLIDLKMPELVSNGQFKIVIVNRAGWKSFDSIINIIDAPSYQNFPPPTISNPTNTPIITVMGKYFFSLNNNNWFDVENWFADENKTIAANTLPNNNADVIVLPDTLRPVVNLDDIKWHDHNTIDAGITGITFVSYMNRKVYAPIIGDVIYEGNASHG
jgi:hypothetical protein